MARSSSGAYGKLMRGKSSSYYQRRGVRNVCVLADGLYRSMVCVRLSDITSQNISRTGYHAAFRRNMYFRLRQLMFESWKGKKNFFVHETAKPQSATTRCVMLCSYSRMAAQPYLSLSCFSQ